MNANKFPIISGKYTQGNIQYGMKWKLFYFGSILKSASPPCFVANFVFFVISIIVSCFTSLYPLSTQILEHLQSDEWSSAFPYSAILSFITPTLFPISTIIFAVTIFFIVFIILFYLAYENSKFILSLWWLFSPHVHIIFYPFVCGIVGFCMSYITHPLDSESGRFLYSIYCINIVLFFVYTFILSILDCIETHSIIGPNPLFSHYFTAMPIIYPFFYAIICCLSFRIIDFDEINQIIVLVFLSAFCLFIGLFILFDKIYMNPLVNKIQSGQFFFMAYSYIFTIITIKSKSYSAIIVYIIPTLAVLTYLLIQYFVEKSRTKTEKFLMQIGDPSTLTVESLATTFELIKSERKFRNIIKVGLSSGQNIVMNETFVRFVLEKFPKSEWMLRYVVFLYSCVWGCDSDTYQFLLHLLSVESLFYSTQMILFETTFCYMQASQTMSPILSRQLEDYRITFLSLCRAHKKFWSSGITSREFEDAQTGILQLFHQTSNDLTRLYKSYRFCPSIMFERSIFESDFKHKYDKSAKYFQKGNNLSKDPTKYISDQLFKRFALFFPGLKQELATSKPQYKETSMTSDGYVFLSSREQNERAIYYSSQLITYDNYIEKLCKPFFIQKNQLQNEYQFFNSNSVFFLCIFIFVISQFLICFALIRVTNDLLSDSKQVYNSALSDLKSTLEFRKNIAIFKSNILLIVDIESETFGDNYTFPYSGNLINMRQFRQFSFKYLQETEKRLISYKAIFDHFNSSYPIENIDQYDFSNAFSKMHVMYETLTPNVDSSQEKKVLGLYLQLFPILVNTTIKNLTEMSENIYYSIIDYLQDFSDNIFNRRKWVFIFMILIDIVAPLIVFVVHQVSLNYIYSKISSIIKTIQPPILKYISETFKKLLTIEEHQMKEKSWYNFVNPGKVLFPTFICFLIHPLIMLLYIFLTNRTVTFNKSLPVISPISNLTRFIYFNRVLLEFGFHDSLLNYGTDIDDKYSFTVSNVYDDHFDQDFQVNCKLFEFPDNLFSFITLIIFCFAIPLFIYFLNLLYTTHKVAMSGRYMLYFLPQVAVNSNPVFQALIRGYHLSIKEVNKFAHDLSKIPEFKGVCCTYFYTLNEDIYDIYGDSEMFLPMKPRRLSEIAQYYENNVFYNPSSDINDFFRNKQPNSTLKLISSNNKDLSITFIPPDQLFIRPELANEETIKKEKLTRYISQISNDYIPKKRAPIQNGFIFIISQLSLSEHTHMIYLAKDLPFIIFDTRNYCIYAALDVYQNDSAHICLNYLKKAPETCCAVIAFGGPMTFFDMPRGTISKSRCIAEAYDICYDLVNRAKPGLLYFTKSFLDRLVPINSHALHIPQFNSLPTSDNKTILFATIQFNCIKELVENTEVKNETPPPPPKPTGMQRSGLGIGTNPNKIPGMMNPTGFSRSKRFGPT